LAASLLDCGLELEASDILRYQSIEAIAHFIDQKSEQGVGVS
jgi:hypothetical protein